MNAPFLPRAQTAPRPRAIVVGSGFGGLALAVRLQAGGFDVTVLEKRDKPGGRAYVYEDAGFTFDGGPTVITDPTCLEEIWTAAGRRMADDVTLVKVDPFYRLCWEDGFTFDYANDQAELDRQIAAVSPGDVAGYRRFLAFSEAVLEKGYIGLGAVPFLDFRSMIKVAPALVKLESYRNVYALVARFIKDEHLRQAFSFHTLLVGGNPFKTSAIYALIHALERRWGVWFPKGGTGALIGGMVRLLESLGGTIRLSSAVRTITTAGGRTTGVVLEDGTRLDAEVVASNADVMHTYRDLLRDDPRGPAEAKRLGRKRYSMSLFVVYFGLKGDHRGLAPPHGLLRPALPRTHCRDLRGRQARRRLLALPPRPERDRSVLGARGAQRLLRALARTASRHRRHRLGRRRDAPEIPRQDLRLSGEALHPEPATRSRDLAHADAVRVPRRDEQPFRLGLLARADPDPECLVPAA